MPQHRKSGYLLLCILFALPLSADEHVAKQNMAVKKIAITFDDAPKPANGYLTGPDRAKMLLESLEKSGVEQAAFFAVSQHLNPEGHQRLLAYSNAGHIIANHTHSHPDLNQIALTEYLSNIDAADSSLKDYPNFRKWFRFPYLREGDTLSKRDGVREHLAEMGYINAYITLNNYDWHIDRLFQRAVESNKELDLVAMRAFYVAVLMESINYYHALALQYTGRSPNHVLLLHENDSAALFIGDLISELRRQGWEIISVEQAYLDPLTEYLTQRVLKFNPGRIGEIAKDNGSEKGLWHTTLNEAYLEGRFTKEVLQEDIRLK